MGLTFNLSQPDKKIVVEDSGVPGLLRRRFGRAADAVAFAATHRQMEFEREGVLFFNPGSPTLPADRCGDDDLGGVAVLDMSAARPRVRLARLTR